MISGIIKAIFPAKKKETYSIIVETPDGFPIRDEMSGVADKSELPKKGDSVPLVRDGTGYRIKE